MPTGPSFSSYLQRARGRPPGSSANGGSLDLGSLTGPVSATASGGSAYSNASGASGRGASQNTPYTNPAPRLDVPGYKVAMGDWQQNVQQLLEQFQRQRMETMRAYTQAMNRYGRQTARGMSPQRPEAGIGGGAQELLQQIMGSRPDFGSIIRGG